MADEKPLSVPVEAFDPELLAASLAQLQAELIGGFTDAGAKAAKAFSDGFKGSSKNLEQVAKDIERIQKAQVKVAKEISQEAKKQTDAEKAAAKATKEHADALAFVEKAWHRALKPSEKTAELLRKVTDLRFDDIQGITAQAVAIARLTEKMEDQQRREQANRGRSLSMLFDEQNELLKLLPGRFGEYAQAIDAARGAAGKAAESFAKMASAGEAGNIALGASIGIFGALVTGGAALAGTLYALESGFYDTVNAIDRVAKGSAISAEQLSRHQVAAKRYGFDLDEFADIHGNIAEKMQRATLAAGGERDMFNALGISVQKADGTLRDVGDVFLELTDYLSTARDKTSALAVAQEFLGEDSAKKLLPAIQAEALGFRKAAQEADALGLSLSGANLDAARQHKKAAEDLTLAWEAFKKRIAEDSTVGRFFDNLKIAAAETLSPGGIVLGVKELENGTKATVKVFRMAGESANEFGERVRQQRAELDAWNEKIRASRDALKQEGAQAETLEEALKRLAAERAKASKKAGGGGKADKAMDIDVVADQAIRFQAEDDAKLYLETFALATRDAAAAGLELPEIPFDVDAFEKDIRTAILEGNKERMESDVKAAKTAIELEEQRRDAMMQTLEIAKSAIQSMGALFEWLADTQIVSQKRAFRATKAAALAQIVIDTALTFADIYKRFPAPGPIGKGIAAGIGAAAVAAQAIPIAAQKAHVGGIVQGGAAPAGWAPDERLIRARQDELIVDQQTTRAMGGPRALRNIQDMARGRTAGGSEIIVVDRRAQSRTMENDYLANGRTRRLINGRRRVGIAARN